MNKKTFNLFVAVIIFLAFAIPVNASLSDSLEEFASKVYAIDGVNYDLELVYVSSSGAKFYHDEEESTTTAIGGSYIFTDRLKITVDDIYTKSWGGGSRVVSFTLNVVPTNVDFPKAADLTVTDIFFNPENPQTNDSLQPSATIKNQGTLATAYWMEVGISDPTGTGFGGFHPADPTNLIEPSETRNISFGGFGPLMEGTYTVTVTVHSEETDSNLSNNQRTETVYVSEENQPPVIKTTSTIPKPVILGDKVYFSVSAFDPDNDELNFAWYVDGEEAKSYTPLIEEDIGMYKFIVSQVMEEDDIIMYIAGYSKYNNIEKEGGIAVMYYDFPNKNRIKDLLERIEDEYKVITYKGNKLYVLEHAYEGKFVFWVHGDDLILSLSYNEDLLNAVVDAYLEKYPSDIEEETVIFPKESVEEEVKRFGLDENDENGTMHEVQWNLGRTAFNFLGEVKPVEEEPVPPQIEPLINTQQSYFVYHANETGEHEIKVIVSDGKSETQNSWWIAVEKPLTNKLAISDVHVRIDGKTEKHLDDGDRISEKAKPGSDVEFEIEVENLFTNEEDVEIEDVEVMVTIQDIDDGDDLEEDSKEFDLKPGDSEEVEIEFEIPLEAEGGIYDVIIEVVGEDGNGVVHKVEWELELDVDSIFEHMEFGTTTITHKWKTITLSREFGEPVVIVNPLSFNGKEPAHIRINSVTSNSFRIKVEEWKYLDGTHAKEDVSYVVMEAGTYLVDGKKIEVGKAKADHRFSNGRVAFEEQFSSTPVVFTQSQTVKGTEPIVTRNMNVDHTGFTVKVQEEENSTDNGRHKFETIGYVAAEEGVYDSIGLEVGKTHNSITDRWATLFFDQTYSTPLFLADMQTTNGGNAVGLRYKNLDAGSVQIKIQEEKSEDKEMKHASEVVGYFVMSSSRI